MRTVIGLCKHCRFGKSNCEHREIVHKTLSKVKLPITVKYNCKEYRNSWKNGDRVEVDLYEILESEYDPYTESGPDIGWGFVETATGTIISVNFGFFKIGLDEPKELNLPEDRNDWHSARYRLVEYINKRSNKIREIT